MTVVCSCFSDDGMLSYLDSSKDPADSDVACLSLCVHVASNLLYGMQLSGN